MTKDEMTVQRLWAGGKTRSVTGGGYDPEGKIEGLDGDVRLLLKIGALCNDASLEEREGMWEVLGDPTEGALLVSARKGGMNEGQLREEFPRLDELPFDSDRKRMSTVHEVKGKRLSNRSSRGSRIRISWGYLIERMGKLFTTKTIRCLTSQTFRFPTGH
jgi:Ca2+-transporting ATPase